MRYFHECTTIIEVKTTYRRLAQLHHPDRGGDTATMQAINTEYALATASILSGSKLSKDETEKEMRFSEEYRQVVEKIIHLPDITVELVGLWIWVTGNTYAVRKALSDAGLHFAPKKKAWFYRAEQYKMLRGTNKSLDQIKNKYGAETIHQLSKQKSIKQK